LTQAPENQFVQALVNHRHRCLVPPTKIVRDFHFQGHIIPTAYEWVFEGIDRAAALFRTKKGAPSLRVSLSFETWQKLAAQEEPFLEAIRQAREKAG